MNEYITHQTIFTMITKRNVSTRFRIFLFIFEKFFKFIGIEYNLYSLVYKRVVYRENFAFMGPSGT